MVVALWIGLLAVVRMCENGWLRPASVLCLALGGTWVSGAVFAPNYYKSTTAGLYLMGAVVAVLLGSMLATTVSRRSSHLATVPAIHLNAGGKHGGFRLLTLGILCSFVSLLMTILVLGSTFGSLLSFSSLATTAQTATANRYESGLSFPLAYSFVNAGVIGFAGAVGFLRGAGVRLTRGMYIPFLLYGMANLLLTTRAPLVMLLLVTAFSYAYGVKARGPMPRQKRRQLLATLGSLVLIVVIFFGFQLLRYGAGNALPLVEIWDRLKLWPLGGVSSFSYWFDHSMIAEQERPIGYYLASGIYDQLGLSERTAGGYATYTYVDQQSATNVYTVMRGMIHDFGLFGSLIVMSSLGFLGSAAYSLCRARSLWGLVAYVTTSSIMMFSFVVSFASFTSNLLGLALVPFVIKYVGAVSFTEPEAANER